MQQTFYINSKSRETLLGFLDKYNLEQLNKVPHGFNNNLIWNIAHIIVTQQLLVYNLAGLPMQVSEDMAAKYKRGTKPEREVAQAELNEIRELLFSTIKQTETDYAAGLFKNYTEYTTSTGVTFRKVEDAMVFNPYHEGIHIGMMMSIRKFL